VGNFGGFFYRERVSRSPARTGGANVGDLGGRRHLSELGDGGVGVRGGSVLVIVLVVGALLAGEVAGAYAPTHGVPVAPAPSTSHPPPVSGGASALVAATASLAADRDLPSALVNTPRYAFAMTYDAADGYVLLFGGRSSSGASLADTWTFVAGNWTQLTPVSHPSAREGASMTYDAKDGYVVLFGGYDGSPLGDTWKFSAGAWTKLSPTSAPSARYDASMTFDSKDHYVLLFGGVAFPDTTMADTWTFEAGTWTQLTVTTPPPARSAASMAYDAKDGYTVLFGGFSPSLTPLGDTWEYVGGTWTELLPAVSPPARAEASMTYDPTNKYLVLFGGSGTSTILSDTWKFAGGKWTLLSPSSHPGPLYSASMTFDSKDGYAVFFGGLVKPGKATGDTWTFLGGKWTELPLTLDSANPLDGGEFGWAVAESSSVVLVGAPGETVETHTQAGHAYAFSASTGKLLSTMTSPNAAFGSSFGNAVAVSGSTAVVAAYEESSDGDNDAGNVYVFNAHTGGLVSTLADPDPQSGGFFGTSVAIYGSTVVVGAFGATVDSDSAAGVAYSFNASTGALIATLSNPSPVQGADFGDSVGISGTTAVVGASEQDVADGNAYTFDADTGALIATFSSPNGQYDGHFGSGVAINRTTIVIGAPWETVSGFTDAGRAYAFNATTLGLMDTFASANAQSYGFFGATVGVSPTRVVAGAVLETADGTPDAGHAYEFKVTNGALVAILTSPNRGSNGEFGVVALLGTTIVVGAIYESTVSGVANAGNAYIFNPPTP
jgi:outer membrane protein assembly factor BamB